VSRLFFLGGGFAFLTDVPGSVVYWLGETTGRSGMIAIITIHVWPRIAPFLDVSC